MNKKRSMAIPHERNTKIYALLKEIKLGNVEPTRDLTYVEDVVAAFLEIYKSKNFIGDIVNIGSNNEISVLDLFEKISSILNSNIELIQDDKRIRPQNSEVDQLVCDNSKLLKNSNWKPKIHFEDQTFCIHG